MGLIPLLRGGFAQAVLGVLRTRPDGLISLGPPCGSFVFINLATSQRSEDCPYGDETKSYVELASLRLSIIQTISQSCLALAKLIKIIRYVSRLGDRSILGNIFGRFIFGGFNFLPCPLSEDMFQSPHACGPGHMSWCVCELGTAAIINDEVLSRFREHSPSHSQTPGTQDLEGDIFVDVLVLN